MNEWWYCSETPDADRAADAERRRADRQAFDERHEARAKKDAPIDVERSHPGLADGVSYSLGDPEAGRVMRQMRADADAARRVHGLGADDDDDD
jgi:hypothetical protein